ncbi:MAG TPA: hypothetical protein VHV49_17540 [Pseudonocardiaceae bacterium]|nr:hypothetical protein [Pseudonocardiaceae bacterium]
MTSMHVVAVAATVLGSTGVLAMAAYRAALRCVDIDLLPGRILPRAAWWRDHLRPMLAGSALLVVVGLAALVGG